MDHNYSSRQIVAACQAFYEAYAEFKAEGTEIQWFNMYDRSIEITFNNCGDELYVNLYCPQVFTGIDSCYDKSLDSADQIVEKILWLSFDSRDVSTYKIKAKDYEEEYNKIRKILVDRYSRCYEDTNAEYWKGTGEEIFIIDLYGRKVKVHCYPNALWDVNGSVVVNVFSLDTGRSFTTAIDQEEGNPKEIIQLIQDLVLEPEIIEFSTTDSEWEHELIRNILVGPKTEEGYFIGIYPFCWVYSWNGAEREERCFILHNREIKMQFEPRNDNMYITLNCVTTGKSYTTIIPDQCQHIEAIVEEVVWKIQELAWS